jgi:hypothetical protein
VWSGTSLTVHTCNGYTERDENMKAERSKKERKKEIESGISSTP